jgi:hypothetical protein
MLTNESRIASLNGGALELTTHRLNITLNTLNNKNFISMTLDEIASCAINHQSDRAALNVGVILGIVGLLMAFGNNEFGFLAIILSVVLIALYYVLRKTVLQIETTGGKTFTVEFGGNSEDIIIAFIKEINDAKLAYLQNKNRTTN